MASSTTKARKTADVKSGESVLRPRDPRLGDDFCDETFQNKLMHEIDRFDPHVVA